ncbi:MAG: nucleotidyltransferase family protein [Candidatus Kariarchaeaceae archaeon]|jgi:CTP:molybdopterin cytidylyltransferase MocA
MKKIYAALILAAGQSTRFGGNKFVAQIKEQPLIKKTIQPFSNTCQSVTVVTGAYTEELKSLLNSLKVTQIHNPGYLYNGMSGSIKIGLKLINLENIYGLFIHPGDIPFVTEDDLQLMIDSLESSDLDIIIPTYGGEMGHPLLIRNQLVPLLNKLDNSREGLRSFVKDYSDRVLLVNSPNKDILVDIDTKKDLMF